MTREEFGDAYERDFQETIRRLMALGAGRDRAEDLAQSAWARGWERLAQLRDSPRLVPWINAIAINLFRDEVALRKSPCQLLLEDEQAASSEIDIRAIDVRRALAQCDPHHRQWLEATYWEGYSGQELAEQTGKAPGAIYTRLSRARQTVREHMQVTRRQVLPRKGVLRMKVQREESVRLSKASGELVSVDSEAINRAS
jgi:RNA polymerase sigma factor (sigma-70 family)